MDESKFVKRRLTDASHTKDTAHRLSLFLATAAGAVFMLLVVALVDYWLILPMTVRIGGVLMLGLIVAAGVLRLVGSLRRPTDLKEVALDAEARKPEAGCELSTAAEYLSGKRKPTQEYESDLAAALEASAANHLKTLQVPYWNRPVPAALFLGACAVAVVLFGAFVTGGSTAFKRAAAPWTDTPYTRVEVQPGNVEIPIGNDLDIKSVFSGRPPRSAQFSWQDEGNAKWHFASLVRNEQGEYVYPLKNVRATLMYRVSGSDAVSSAFKVEPYIPPEVKEWQVELELPAYTKRPKITQDSPHISVLRGTVASFQVAPSTKLSKAILRFEEGAPVELKPSHNGFWHGNVTISQNAKYWIELADEKGRTGGNETPFQITSVTDDPPQAEIPEPGQDMRAQATNSLPVKISVTDDYGLKEIKLVYHKLGGPEQFITAQRDGETNTEFTVEIPLSSLPLEEYDLVAYHAEATDNNTLDGPGIGRSDVYFVEITNEEGGSCKSQGKAQQVNLLVIQKQIIADTSALAAKASPEKFEELAQRQKDATEFGRIYTQALTMRGAAAALAEMQSAVSDMESAQSAFERQLRGEALPPAERALAHLYKVLKLMPELEDLPTTPPEMQQQKQTNRPPVLNVVLNAIKKKKENQPENQELAEALEEAERLQDEQSSLNIGVQNSGDGQGEGEMQLVRATSESKPRDSKPKAKAQNAKSKGDKAKANKGKSAKAKSEAKGGGKGKQGQGKQGEQKPEEEKPEEPNESTPEEKQELAQKQEELSKEAAALAEKLARLAGKDVRLGHNAGNKMNEAAGNMNGAARAMAKGDVQAAGIKGAESDANLNTAIAEIQRALNNRPPRVDVSQEASPKEYEMVIAEYLKKLSYEE